MNRTLVSIVISNYNYGRFLPEAIDSALSQTYPNIEIIVADDGSTDDSREIIESYGDRIIAVLKDNGGQASACNAGFRASKGEVVIFLDADDALLADTVRRVVTAFQAHPGAVKVQYRKQIVDAYGRPTGELQPPCYQPMLSGDLRRHILKFHSYIWPSTSGNAFASSVLRQILPIPETLYRGTPDIYLCNLSVIFGLVLSLDEPGVLYRVHGANNYFGTFSSTNTAVARSQTLALADSYARQERLFNSLYSADVRDIGARDPEFLINRVISKKLDPQNHPLREALLSLCVRGCIISTKYLDTSKYKHRRLVYALWFLGMLLAPRSLAKLLVEMFYYPERRGRILNGLFPPPR